MPSARKLSVRLSRLMPTARAIPISDRRSAASITKMRKISMIPAAIEKRPKTMKKVTKTDPSSSAIRTRSSFEAMMVARLSGFASMKSSIFCSTRLSVSASESRVPPAVETPMNETRPDRSRICWAVSRFTIIPPGGSPVPSPSKMLREVSDVSRTTPMTSNVVGRFSTKTVS
jgi:hypothetical protein